MDVVFPNSEKGILGFQMKMRRDQLYVCLDSKLSDTNQQVFQLPEIEDLARQCQFTQGSGGHIGPIPNMETAISAINSLHDGNE